MKRMKLEARTANSTYKKLADQWLNEVLCFVSSSVVADSFRLRNRQLLVAAKRYKTQKKLFMATRHHLCIKNQLLMHEPIGSIIKIGFKF